MPANREAEACGGAPSATTGPVHPPASRAAPAKPAQSSVSAASDQQTPAAPSSKPVSAARASQSSAAAAMPQLDKCQALSPHELKVAAALLVVMSRSAKDGINEFSTIKQVLTCNNPFVSMFMELLPDHSKLPSLKQLERSATVADQETLRMLSEQCAAAGCEPLEVFTRSAECLTHIRSLAKKADGELKVRQQRLQAVEASLSISAAAKPREKAVLRKLHEKAEALAQHGVAQTIRELIEGVLHETILLLDADKTQLGAATTTAGSRSSFTACVDHMLPGVLDALLEHHSEDLTSVDDLLKMVAPLERALESYRNRAVAAKRSPEHMVMLEAAVQGWPKMVPHSTCLSDKIIEALTSSSEAAQLPPSDSTSRPASTASKSTKDAVRQGPVLKFSDLPVEVEKVYECPADVDVIMNMLLGCTLVSSTSGEEGRLAALLKGLLPGIEVDLYCALDGLYANMRHALSLSAQRHLEGFVQVWNSELGEKGLGLSDLLHQKVKALGFEPSELPEEVEGAIQDISARVGAVSADKVCWHRLNIGVLAALHDLATAGKGASLDLWQWKALAQLHDLYIHHAEGSKPFKAANALLTGPMEHTLARRAKDPGTPEKESLVMKRQAMKEAVQKHALLAKSQGKTLRAYLTDLAGNRRRDREAGQSDVAHLIDILVDHIGVKGGPSGEAWRKASLQSKDVIQPLEIAFVISATRDAATYTALRKAFPGLPDYLSNDDRSVTTFELLRAAKLLKQQLQVHKHIASVKKAATPVYISCLLVESGVETQSVLVMQFGRAVMDAVDGTTVNIAMAKTMHISMRIKWLLDMDPLLASFSYLVLLDKHMSICAEHAATSRIVKAACKLMPGVLECLVRLHEWPHGLRSSREWLHEVTMLMADITEQHGNDACDRGISPEEHIRNISAVPGLRNAEAELLVSMFREFWAAQSGAAQDREASASDATDQAPDGPACDSPVGVQADSSADARKPSDKGIAGTSAGSSSHTSAEAVELSQQGADMAADIPEGASGKDGLTQADPSQPEQAEQAAAKPQSGLSEAEKAERRKAKKARQRADRAQAAAQSAEAEGTAIKEPGPAERMGCASQQKQSADAQAAGQLPEALQLSGLMNAAPEDLPAPTTPAHLHNEAASVMSSPLSPQPSLQLHAGIYRGQPEQDMPSRAAPAPQAPLPEDLPTPTASVPADDVPTSSVSSPRSPQPSLELRAGVYPGQPEQDLPSRGAPAAQVPGTPSQEEEGWQKVKKSRRKPTSQQKAGTDTSPKQSRLAPDHYPPTSPPSHLREVQAAASHRGQPSPRPEKAGVPFNTQPGHAAAKQSSQPAFAPAESTPQQHPHQECSGSLRPPRPQACPFSMQPLQDAATSSPADKPCLVPQQTSALRACSEMCSHEQGAKTAELPEDNEPDEEDLCIVCWEELREVVFYHCMHMCTCQGCARDIMAAGGLCPMCRAKIQSTIIARF